jgi:metal-responsive CopG/Arc/MetJ family transcriptional regulator
MNNAIASTVGEKMAGDNTEKKWVSISLHRDLIHQIDSFIDDDRFYGYTSRTDFITEAVRLRLEELKKLYDDTFPERKED